MQFLMGLNESYSARRGQILPMNPLPSVRQAYSFVCQEEKKRLLSATHTAAYSNSSAAVAIRSNNMKNNSAECKVRSFRPLLQWFTRFTKV